MAYKIKQGDTLSGLAKANNTDLPTLLKLNPGIKDPNLIRAGATLNLPSSGDAASLQGTMKSNTGGTENVDGSGATGGAPTIGAPGSGTAFNAALSQFITKSNENQDLVDQKNLMLKHLFDTPLTPDEMAKLPGTVQMDLMKGNQDLIKLNVALINDQLQGRVNTTTQAIKYIIDGYKSDLDNAEKARDDARTQIKDSISSFGSQAFAGLSPESKRGLEKEAGFPAGYLDNLPQTMDEKKMAADAKKSSTEKNAATYDDIKTSAAQSFESYLAKNGTKEIPADVYRQYRDKVPSQYRDDFDRDFGDYLSDADKKSFAIKVAEPKQTFTDSQYKSIGIGYVKSLGVADAKKIVNGGTISVNGKQTKLGDDQIKAIIKAIDDAYPSGERSTWDKILPGGK